MPLEYLHIEKDKEKRIKILNTSPLKLPPLHDSMYGPSNIRSRIFNLLLREAICHADFERGLRLPCLLPRICAESLRHIPQTGDEDVFL
jgi:hypothetical protein